MIVILNNKASDKQIDDVIKYLEDYGFQIHKSVGVERTILGAIGVKPNFDIRKIKILDGVADVYRITAPYKLDRKSTRLNSSHTDISRMPSSA